MDLHSVYVEVITYQYPEINVGLLLFVASEKGSSFPDLPDLIWS